MSDSNLSAELAPAAGEVLEPAKTHCEEEPADVATTPTKRNGKRPADPAAVLLGPPPAGPKPNLPTQAAPSRGEPVDPVRPVQTRRGRQVAVLSLISLAVGLATVLLAPFEYRGSALFSVDLDPDDSSALAPYYVELVNHALGSVPDTVSGPAFRWDVVADAGSGTVRLDLISDAPEAGRVALEQIAEGYLARISRLADRALTQASDGERIWQDRLDHLRSGLSETERRMQSTRAAMPDDGVDLRHDQAGRELRQQRGKLLRHRDLRRTAQARLTELESHAVPEHPVIEPELRQRTLQADVTLQQDLAELKVRRTAARTQLLSVWQNAAPALEGLVVAASGLQQSLGEHAGDPVGGAHLTALERAAEAVDEYRTRLRSFSQDWTRTFVSLSREENFDHEASVTLDAQERVTSLLADFLFQASSSLTVIRDQMRGLYAESDAQARLHVLTAELTRGFHALQTAHHRFEFVASEVQTANNFRLAAAVKSVRGLGRRSQLRRQELEGQLEQRVRQQLEQTRQADIHELQELTDRLRTSTDADLDAMLEHLEDFDALSEVMVKYAAGRATSDAMAERIGEVAGEIDDARTRLHALSAQRQSPVRPELVRLISCEVDPKPSNSTRRLAYGWAAAATALLAMLLVQGLVRRRRGN